MLYIILKGNLERTVFPNRNYFIVKEGCLKISVINKPGSYNFFDSETLHLPLKAGGGQDFLFSIDCFYCETVFYGLVLLKPELNPRV